MPSFHFAFCSKTQIQYQRDSIEERYDRKDIEASEKAIEGNRDEGKTDAEAAEKIPPHLLKKGSEIEKEKEKEKAKKIAAKSVVPGEPAYKKPSTEKPTTITKPKGKEKPTIVDAEAAEKLPPVVLLREESKKPSKAVVQGESALEKPKGKTEGSQTELSKERAEAVKKALPHLL